MATTPDDATREDLLHFTQPLELVERAAGDPELATDAPAEDERIKLVISTETPVEQTRGILEVLGHGKNEVDLTYARNGLSLLLEHGRATPWERIDPERHIGIVEDIALEGTRLIGWARFSDSPLAQQIKRDVLRKIRKFTSVGAVTEPSKIKLVKRAQQPGEKHEVRHTRWAPTEVTLTSVPASPDTRAIVRTAVGEHPAIEITALETEGKEERTMSQTKVETTNGDGAGGSAAPAATVERSAAEQLADRNKEVGQIVTLCRSYNCPDKASDFIERGLSVDQAKLAIFDGMVTRGGRAPAAESLDGLSTKDRKRFRYRRALAMQLAVREGGGKIDGLEGEVHRHLEKHMPQGVARAGGILVPLDLRTEDEIEEALERDLQNPNRIERTMDSKTAGKGAELVPQVSGQLIELLQANSVATRLGAQLLSGLTAPITFPRETGAPTVRWKGENPGVDVSEDDASTGELELAPKSMIGAVKMSRELILQTSGQAENMIRKRLTIGHDLAIDRAYFHGTGAGSQPTGLYNLAGVLAVAMGSVTPTYIKITDMIGNVGDQNVENGAFGFFTTKRLAARLKSTLKFSAAGSTPIWEGTLENGTLDGYNAVASTQIRSNLGAGTDEHGFGYGAFDQSVIGMFGAFEILLDPLTGALQGLVKVRSFSYGDVIFQHPEAFCVGTAAKPA